MGFFRLALTMGGLTWVSMKQISVVIGQAGHWSEAAVAAGFPSPADDHREEGLDLTRRFVRHPQATFMVRAAGESLSGMGIYHGDYLMVDRSRRPQNGDVVIAVVDGEFTAKCFRIYGNSIRLEPANPAFPCILWHEGCEIWGVVTSVHRDVVGKS